MLKDIGISEIGESYDLVRIIFENNFKITDGINYESAKIGNEFELAKVRFNKFSKKLNNLYFFQ